MLPRFQVGMRDMLQWGHGSEAVETARRPLAFFEIVDASMGPRRGGRGNGSRTCPVSCSRSCFNGAAARRP